MISSSFLDDLINRDLQQACALRPVEPDLQFRDFLGGRQSHVVAVLVPMSGTPGMYGPSCIASTQLAVSEVNARGGVAGHKLEVVFLDANVINGFAFARDLGDLIQSGAITGVISAASTEVWQWLDGIIAGQVPHIYTLSCTGNELSPNNFMIGSTRYTQLAPTIRRLTSLLKVRKWALIGRDSLWPRLSRMVARQSIAKCGGSVVHESYLPSGGSGSMPAVIEGLVQTQPDIVFMSLVGQDAVEFNRLFGELDLDRKMFRFCEVASEETLMGSGKDGTKGLFSSAAYFASLDADIHLAFSDRYHALHGDSAPVINAHGQSLYEGIQFYAALVHHRQNDLAGPIMYPTARGGVFHSNWHKEDPIYLAEADGLRFQVLEELQRRTAWDG